MVSGNGQTVPLRAIHAVEGGAIHPFHRGFNRSAWRARIAWPKNAGGTERLPGARAA
jgi:hypothetical protein